MFPGQGAAASGAGEPWRRDPAWSVVTEAEAVLDRPLAHLLLDADAAELATTRSSQLAVFLTSLVAWEAVAPRLPGAPVAFAGHSLGQITALVASGTVDRPDGFRLAARRADLSQESADANPGRMAALAGADLEAAERLCDAIEDLWVANDNAPGQVVVAGTAGAAEGLRPLVETMRFHEPTAPIMGNTDAVLHADSSGWPDRLCRHLMEPVQWRLSQERLAAAGADTFLEIGPGRVLAGLAKRTVPQVTVNTIAQPAELVQLGAAGTLSEVGP